MSAKRSRYQFYPDSTEPYAISRSRIDYFLECPRCFYLDQRLGVKRPGMPGFSLNSAVDALLKNEFDALRKKKQSHALMEMYGINAIPFDHEEIDDWRNNFRGARFLHKPTSLIIFGSIDDIWEDVDTKELYIVDYKATSTQKEISLEDEYKQGYKLQMEIYQWIFRQNGFPVSDIGYFVFANATKDRDGFDGRLEFDLSIIPHKGDSSWVEKTVINLKDCLMSEDIPPFSDTCEYCKYNQGLREHVVDSTLRHEQLQLDLWKKQMAKQIVRNLDRNPSGKDEV